MKFSFIIKTIAVFFIFVLIKFNIYSLENIESIQSKKIDKNESVILYKFIQLHSLNDNHGSPIYSQVFRFNFENKSVVFFPTKNADPMHTGAKELCEVFFLINGEMDKDYQSLGCKNILSVYFFKDNVNKKIGVTLIVDYSISPTKNKIYSKTYFYNKKLNFFEEDLALDSYVYNKNIINISKFKTYYKFYINKQSKILIE